MAQVSYGTITITDTTDLITYIRYAKQVPLQSASDFQETPNNDTHYIAVLSIPSSDTIPAYNSNDWHWSEFIGTDGLSVKSTRVLYYLNTGSSDAPQVTTETTIVMTDTNDQWTSLNPTYITNAIYWTCLEVTLSDNTTKSWSAPIKDLGLTQTAKDAAEAKSIAQQANGNAQSALSIANSTEIAQQALATKLKYMWTDETEDTTTPAGSYMASGINGVTFSVTNPSTYGFNSQARHTHTAFRYNAIDLTTVGVDGVKLYFPIISNNVITNSALGTELTANGLNFYQPPTISNNTVTQGALTMSLSNEALKFYDPSNGNEEEIASFGSIAKIGKENAAHINITSGGLDLYKGTTQVSNLITHLGYDSSVNSGTTPYFTLGTRARNLSNDSEATSVTPGLYSMVEGLANIAQGQYSHAEGTHTEAVGNYSHAEGAVTYAVGNYSHTEGSGTYAIGDGSHAGGADSYAGTYDSNDVKVGNFSFVHGDHVNAVANFQTVFGKNNEEDTDALFIIGNGSAPSTRSNLMVVGDNYIRVGNLTNSHLLMDFHSLKLKDKEQNEYFLVEDLRNEQGIVNITRTIIANGESTDYTFSPTAINTSYTVTVSDASGGTVTKATSYIKFTTPPTIGAIITIEYTSNNQFNKIFTFGTRDDNFQVGAMSYAEGINIKASGYGSHAEGNRTEASGSHAHAEGSLTRATGAIAHAEGIATIASGWWSHAQNSYTIAASNDQTALGRYNIEDNNNIYAFIIGNGDNSTRSNALTVDWNGNIKVANHLTAIGYTNNDSGSTKINSATSPYTPAKLSGAITLSTGTYVLMGEVSFPGNATGIRHIEWKEGASENSASTILSSRVTTSAAPAGAATKLQSTVIVNVTGSSHNYYLYCYHTSVVSQMEISYYWNFVRIV